MRIGLQQSVRVGRNLFRELTPPPPRLMLTADFEHVSTLWNQANEYRD
jgi:hypothetical protein